MISKMNGAIASVLPASAFNDVQIAMSAACLCLVIAERRLAWRLQTSLAESRKERVFVGVGQSANYMKVVLSLMFIYDGLYANISSPRVIFIMLMGTIILDQISTISMALRLRRNEAERLQSSTD